MTSTGQKDREPAKMQEQVVESPQVLPLSLPHYVGQPGSACLSHDYHSLGHFLRSNIFPGASFPWKSVTKETYISHPVTARPADPSLWPGRIRDEMTQWREKNITDRNINKMLSEREKKSLAK